MELDFTNISILVTGDVILDEYIHGDVSRISPEAPVPVIKHIKNKTTLGGAANVAYNLINLGCNVTLIGIIGNDANGKKLKKLLKEIGIRSQLIELDNFPTITKTRVLSNGHQICRIDIEEPHDNNTEILASLLTIDINYKKYDALIISDYNKGFIENDVSKYLIGQFKNGNKPVIVDPKKTNWDLYKNATVITPNFKEFSATVDYCSDDIEQIVKKARKIIKQYKFGSILITRSEKGMLWVDKESHINIGTEAKEVFDVSGAGDTVVATISASIAKGNIMKSSINYANIAAGIVVGKIGTSPITINELKGQVNLGTNGFVEMNDLCNGYNKKEIKVLLSEIEENSLNFIEILKSYKNHKKYLLFIVIYSDDYYEIKFGKKPTFLSRDKLSLFSHLDFVDGVTSIGNYEQELLIEHKLVKL